MAAPAELEQIIRAELRQPIEQLVRQVVVDLVREQLNGDRLASSQSAVSGPENAQEATNGPGGTSDYPRGVYGPENVPCLRRAEAGERVRARPPPMPAMPTSRRTPQPGTPHRRESGGARPTGSLTRTRRRRASTAGSSTAVSPRTETASSSQQRKAASWARSSNERSPLLDGTLATAPQTGARLLRPHLPGRRAALHRLRDNRPPSGPELAGAAPVLGAREPRRQLQAVQLRRRRRIAAQNTRATIERLQAVVEEQQQQIAELLETIANLEDAKSAKRATPAIR